MGDDGVEVEDLSSRNGLYAGAARVERATLCGRSSDLTIGRSTLCVQIRDRAPESDSMGLVGETEPMRELRAQVRRFAALRAPVLVLGESGTGKDMVARALYQASSLSGAYVATNVAALSESLIDAELFGHTRGAFTGAVGARAGAFQLADKGLLFLDEIAELCPAGQAKLLRVVEDGRVRPVGADREVAVNPRLVFATCAPLAEQVASGHFREDLFHRISVLTLHVPPLRARRADIPLLVRTFLQKKEDELGRRSLSEASLEYLMRQRFSGNVRQLFSCVYAACALSASSVIAPCHLRISEPEERGPSLDPAMALRILEAAGSVSAAARQARVPRTTFRALVARAKGK
jgi:DNA-binding NtrC family response regulator